MTAGDRIREALEADRHIAEVLCVEPGDLDHIVHVAARAAAADSAHVPAQGEGPHRSVLCGFRRSPADPACAEPLTLIRTSWLELGWDMQTHPGDDGALDDDGALYEGWSDHSEWRVECAAGHVVACAQQPGTGNDRPTEPFYLDAFLAGAPLPTTIRHPFAAGTVEAGDCGECDEPADHPNHRGSL